MQIFKRNKNKLARWSKKEIIFFFERLELYSNSGLPINKSMQILTQSADDKQARVLSSVNNAIEQGNTFCYALENNIKLPRAILGLISQGEATGRLSLSLGFAKQLLEREEDIKKKCLSAMTYPMVIGVFALGLTFGLMKGVIPQIIPLLKSLKVQLPLITRIVMSVSDAITDFGIYIALGSLFFAVLFYALYKKQHVFQFAIQTAILKIPLLGKLISFYITSFFARSLGSQIESGIPLSQAYNAAVLNMSFLPVKRQLENNIAEINRGISLGAVLGKVKGLPSFVPSLVSAGELTGTLGISLTRSSNIIDRDIEYSLKKITSLIEPVMMAGMGAVIGAIALSIIMPIYDVSKVLQH